MNRRQFVGGAGGGLLAAALTRPLNAATSRTQLPLFLDAMGEIRLTHPMELIREVLASGTGGVGITLTDPKVFGEAALDTALRDLAAYDRHIAAHSDLLLKATAVADIDRARDEGKLALLYMLQNTTPIQKELDRVDQLHRLGLRCLQLTYNYQNYAGSGCREIGNYGLTAFGRELIERMNDLGMLVDTSHANMATMAAAITASQQPTIVSHTACAALHAHVRNTTDANLRLLADRGGVVGICQIRPFLTGDRSADNVRFYFDHIMHAVSVAGIEHVCIGSDRDHRVIEDSAEEIATLMREEGAQFVPEDWPLYMPAMNGPRRMEIVWDGLLTRGLSEDQVELIMGRNLYRLYAEVLG